jgi:hypothetical protein
MTYAAGPERIIPNPQNQQRIQEIVNEFMTRLTMGHKVAVTVVPKNPLMVSVEYTDTSTGFLLSVEEDFINELTPEELEAAIAHELGHVWIFTHHPYLQTEQLANQIAMRVVSRQTIEAVYVKVRARGGHIDRLARFAKSNAN